MYHNLYLILYPRTLVDRARDICDANRMTSRATPIRDQPKILALLANADGSNLALLTQVATLFCAKFGPLGDILGTAVGRARALEGVVRPQRSRRWPIRDP
jgi:hypothetical protein